MKRDVACSLRNGAIHDLKLETVMSLIFQVARQGNDDSACVCASQGEAKFEQKSQRKRKRETKTERVQASEKEAKKKKKRESECVHGHKDWRKSYKHNTKQSKEGERSRVYVYVCVCVCVCVSVCVCVCARDRKTEKPELCSQLSVEFHALAGGSELVKISVCFPSPSGAPLVVVPMKPESIKRGLCCLNASQPF